MRLHDRFRRRIRIEGKLDDLKGYRLSVRDVETDEEIINVIKAVITLDAREYNGVELTYAETDENGKYIIQHGDIVQKRLRLNFPEISLTALEELMK